MHRVQASYLWPLVCRAETLPSQTLQIQENIWYCVKEQCRIFLYCSTNKNMIFYVLSCKIQTQRTKRKHPHGAICCEQTFTAVKLWGQTRNSLSKGYHPRTISWHPMTGRWPKRCSSAAVPKTEIRVKIMRHFEVFSASPIHTEADLRCCGWLFQAAPFHGCHKAVEENMTQRCIFI